MMRRSIRRSGFVRNIADLIRGKKGSAQDSLSKEAALLAKHHIYTADCWARVSSAQRASLISAGLTSTMAEQLDTAAAELARLSKSGEMSPHKRVLVLFGSQTGTAENYAKMLSMMSASHGYQPVLCSMDDGIAALKQSSGGFTGVFFCVSTCGSGEFPRNATHFVEALKTDAALQQVVKTTPYGILGLGNSANDHFNQAAKTLDIELKKLGSQPLFRMQLSCELAADGHAAAFRDFKQKVWSSLPQEVSGPGKVVGLSSAYTLAPSASAADRYVPNDFLTAVVQGRQTLTYPTKQVLAHHVLALKTTVPVTTADHIEIMPRNAPYLVDRALNHLLMSGDVVVDITPLPGSSASSIDGKRLKIRTLLEEVVDLTAPPTRSFLESMSMVAGDNAQRRKLDKLANDLSENNEYLQRVTKGGWTIVDAMEEFTNVHLTLAHILTHASRIVPRKYTVSAVNGNVVEIVFSVPTKLGPHGDPLHGLCSGYLSELATDAKVNARVVPSGIEDPAIDQPLLLVALGTGVGCARAMLRNRLAAKRAGKTVGPAVLYYGFRHTGLDQLFTEEFAEMEAADVVQMKYVASHDVEGKFVTPMDKFDDSINDFLGSKGSVVYSGLGGSVPLVVESALRKHKVDVSALRTQGRYIEEYFSTDLDTEDLLAQAGHLQSSTSNTLAGRMLGSKMFCMQCEQTYQNKGCNTIGVCGKTPMVAALQDAAVHACKLLGFYLHKSRELKVPEDTNMNRKTLSVLFTTLTNVNFDEDRFIALLAEVQPAIEAAKERYVAACQAAGVTPAEPAVATMNKKSVKSKVEMNEFGKAVGVLSRFQVAETQNGAAVSEMLMYGLKGIAAYADHSLMNGKEDPAIYAYMHKSLAFLAGPDNTDLGKALELCLEGGSINVATMGLLYSSNSTLGVPKPKEVPLKPKPGKCILVSGHDLIILKGLLEKTEPLGINVYTHGEMLPAHSYEKLNQYRTLAGHFGGAWMRQSVEFPTFPGAILMTTNCLTEPQDAYKARLFTAGAVGWNKVPHIGNTMDDINFDALIRSAQEAPGFTAADKEFSYVDPVGVKRPASLTVGFGHETILSVAPVIKEQIAKGNITRFFVVGGCDGFEGQRSYYTELVRKMPKTAVILTVGCGKFRINHLELGTIGDTGVPRILDVGQCNDSFSAVQVAIALAGLFECKVTDLPLSIVLSWFEQKAVAVLLSCLALGLKPVHVGPSLPAFVTPDVLNVLVEKFGVRVCGDPDKDLALMLGSKGMGTY